MSGSNTDIIHRMFLMAIYVMVITGRVCADEKPRLQISESNIWEFGNVTLICSCPETTNSNSYLANWYLQRPNGNTSTIFIKFNSYDSSCINEYEFADINYTYHCLNVQSFVLRLLNVSRQENGYQWQCSCGYISTKSNNITVSINVPVKSVNLRIGNTNISSDTTIHLVNDYKTTLECSSTCARPEASITWYRDINTSSNVSNTTNTKNGLICSQSVFSFIPTLESQGKEIYCSVINKENEPLFSPKITVDVLYPPFVGKLPNLSVIEGKDLKISCNEVPGNPNETSYHWSNRKNSIISKDKVLRILNVSRKNETFFTCTVTNEMKPTVGPVLNGTSNKTFHLTVFYKPRITNMNLQSNSSDGIEVLGENISIIERESFNISCIANSKPEPRIYWTGPVTAQSQELKIRDVKRDKNGTYVCISTNEMNVDNITEHGRSQANVTLNILYPPRVVQLHNTSTIVGRAFSISCDQEKEGNPSKTQFSWSTGDSSDIIKQKVLSINTVSRANETVYTCAVNNVMKSKTGREEKGTSSTKFYLTVFYPPKITSLNLKINSKSITQFKDNVSVVENSTIYLNCSSDSKPPPNITWKGPQESNIHELSISTIKRMQRGEYTCISTNKMEINNTKELGHANSSIILKVLYPPEMEKLQNVVVTEGSIFKTTCQGKNGNPAFYDYEWTWNGQVIPVRNQTLVITNVSKTNDTNYQCKVNNTMIATEGEPQFGYVSDQFHLNVTYKAFVEEFYLGNGTYSTNITVSEKEVMTFNCTIGGNPKPRVSLTFKDKNLSVKSWSNVLIFKHKFTSCHSSGSYTCVGENQVNKGQPASRTIYVQVNCTPLPTKDLPSVIELASKMNASKVFNFTTIAFPEPGPTGFTWYKFIENSSWIVVQKSEQYMIRSSNLESNLTIRSITEAEYGRYMLKVNNSVGILVQNYTLRPEDVPSKPTHFMILNESVTETSVIVSWKKGFNGGYKQTFILKYYKLTTESITNITIYETNTNVMECTIGNLSSGSRYWLELRTRNAIGENMFPLVLYFTTAESVKGPEDKIYANNIGSTLGIVFGIITFLALIAASGFILYKRREKTGKDEQPLYQNVVPGYAKNSKNRELKSLPMENIQTEDLPKTDDGNNIKEDNFTKSVKDLHQIQVHSLFQYLLGSNDDMFENEYKKLPDGLQKPCTFARTPENIALNRYNGIYPYDHSRVKLQGHPEFFINACYIDGYKRNKAYIASLGPTSNTTDQFKTFWLMLWYERSDMIIMLTNLHEPSGMKCQQYWPGEGTKKQYGDVLVASEKTDVFAEYTIRTFTVSMGREIRKLTHLHFTAWPDKTVPEDEITLLDLRQKMKDTHTSSLGPVVVHCSAGIGRTGTFIAIDKLIEEGLDIGAVNVFECVRKMREQRVKMVQTLEQYTYIYKTLVCALSFKSEVIPCKGIQKYLENTSDRKYNLLFKDLSMSIEGTPTSRNTGILKVQHENTADKNRLGADRADAKFSVMLNLTDGEEGSEYINAVYINTVGQYLPAQKHVSKFGKFEVSCSTFETKQFYIIRKMKIKYSGEFERGEKCVFHFHFTNWMTGNDTPGNVNEFVNFVNDVEEYASELAANNSSVVVHCLKANERSGLFCVVANIMERIKREGQVNILNIIRHLRTRRHTAITSKEQLKFCFAAADAFEQTYKE